MLCPLCTELYRHMKWLKSIVSASRLCYLCDDPFYFSYLRHLHPFFSKRIVDGILFKVTGIGLVVISKNIVLDSMFLFQICAAIS